MIQDEDLLEKDDMYILDRMREFLKKDDVYQFAAAKGLLTLIERSVCTTPPLPLLIYHNPASLTFESRATRPSPR
jgi:hypothetical protein